VLALISKSVTQWPTEWQQLTTQGCGGAKTASALVARAPQIKPGCGQPLRNGFVCDDTMCQAKCAKVPGRMKAKRIFFSCFLVTICNAYTVTGNSFYVANQELATCHGIWLFA